VYVYLYSEVLRRLRVYVYCVDIQEVKSLRIKRGEKVKSSGCLSIFLVADLTSSHSMKYSKSKGSVYRFLR
jgi:hypothetical protein